MIKEIVSQTDIFKIATRIARWHLKYFFKRQISPLACGFYITSKCNFRCSFCNIWRINPAFQADEPEAKRIIKELAQTGLVYFSFSGGEPLLVPYIFDLLALAKQSGILYTHVVSNGYLMDEYKAKESNKACLSEISFSIDGNRQVHDQKRNMPGAFDKVHAAVEAIKLHAPKTNIVLNTIFDPVNPQDALFAVNTAKKLKVKIKVQPINNHPCFDTAGSPKQKRHPLNSQQKEELIKTIGFMQRTPSVANSRVFLENYKAFLLAPEKLMLARQDCIFGYHHIELFQNTAFPCLEGFNWKNGFAIAGSIKEMLNSEIYRDKVRELRKCRGCNNNYYVCYYEPRLNFPLGNFFKSRFSYVNV